MKKRKITRDWSQLHPDLLCEILRRLGVEDHLCFSVVCRSWNSAAQERRHLPALQPPWLLMPHPDEKHGKQLVSFRSLSGCKKNYRVPLPIDFANRILLCSTCGWLVTTSSSGRIFMLNPLTQIEIELPSVTTFPDVRPWDFEVGVVLEPEFYSRKDIFVVDPAPALPGGPSNFGPEPWRLDELTMVYFKKVLVIPACSSQSSTLACGYTVVAIIFHYSIAIFRNGDTKWTIIRQPQSSKYTYFKDIAHIGGTVYALTEFGTLFTLNICTTAMEELCAENPYELGMVINLVPLANDLLLVSRVIMEEYNENEIINFITEGVDIYKLDLLNKSWVEVETLDHYCLFIGLNQGLSFSTHDFPELQANSIYFTDNFRNHIQYNWEKRRDMGVFDYEEKVMRPIADYDERLTWPPPLWFTPSLFDLK